MLIETVALITNIVSTLSCISYLREIFKKCVFFSKNDENTNKTGSQMPNETTFKRLDSSKIE